MFFHKTKSQKALFLKSIVLTLIGVLLVLFFAIAGLYITNTGSSAAQGVAIGDIPVHNLSREQAKQLLQQRIDALLQQDITFHINDTTRTASLASTGAYINIDATLQQAYQYGKSGAFYNRAYKQIQLLFNKKTFPLVVSFNKQLFEEYIENTFQGLYTLPQNAQLRYSVQDQEFKIIDPVEGIVIDTEKLQNDITLNIQNFSPDAIRVSHLTQTPLTVQQPQQLKKQAQAIIDKDIELLIRGDAVVQVPKQELALWAVFTHQENNTLSVAYPDKPIRDYLKTLAEKYDVEPRNLRFIISNGVIRVLQRSTAGYELQLQQGVAIIQTALNNNQEKITLPTTTLPAPVNESNVNSLQFVLLGTGTSDYAGSPSNRMHNIAIGSNKYQGMVIGPGEEFSFNENLGPINAATGYLPELVIKNNQTIPEYGGGLCQVSTTIFRAAVHTGLDITQRKSHSYVVRYYGTPGFDSTIYPPNPDLRFKNNTSGHIMMQYRIEGTKLMFDMYGTKDGRRVVVTGPVPYDIQEDGAQKAWLKQQVVDQNNNPIHEEVFYSIYKPPKDFPVNRNPLE